MGTGHVDQVVGWVIFVEQNIGGQADATMNAFKEVVTQKRVLWHPLGQRPFKGIDVINAFAHIDADAKEILINVRDGQRVEVKPAVAGKDAGKERTVSAGRFDHGAWLENRVTGVNSARHRIEFGPI